MTMEQFNCNSTFSIKITEPITNLQFINTHTHTHTHTQKSLIYYAKPNENKATQLSEKYIKFQN